MNEQTELLKEIRDLLQVIAEPGLAKRDEKRRSALREIIGKSQQKIKAALLMDGSLTQSAIGKQAESIFVYKAMLVAISRAFDLESIDRLLFLESCKKDFLVVSGDGLLHFGRLIAAGLAKVDQKSNNSWQIVTYAVNISDKGRLLIEAWKQGDRTRLRKVMAGPVPGGVRQK